MAAKIAIIMATHKPARMTLVKLMYVYGITSNKSVLIDSVDKCMSLIATLYISLWGSIAEARSALNTMLSRSA